MSAGRTPGRRIVLFQQLSADGFFTTPDGALDWTVREPGVEQAAASSIQATPGAGTILFGRKTYDQFESFWPHALDRRRPAEGSHGPHGEANPDSLRAMALFIDGAEKIVFTRSRKEVTWNNSRILREVDPAAIAALKREPGRDIMVFGSGTIVSLLTEHRLIDEYQLVVSPVLLGAGRPLLEGVTGRLALELEASQRFDSGVVFSRYVPVV